MFSPLNYCLPYCYYIINNLKSKINRRTALLARYSALYFFHCGKKSLWELRKTASFLICSLSHDRPSPLLQGLLKKQLLHAPARGGFFVAGGERDRYCFSFCTFLTRRRFLRPEKETGTTSPFAPSPQGNVLASRGRERRSPVCTFRRRPAACRGCFFYARAAAWIL